jgi:hypothetical protein
MNLSKAIRFIWDREAFLGPLIAEGITGLLIIAPLVFH